MTRAEKEIIEKITELTNIVVQMKEKCDGYERENKHLKEIICNLTQKRTIT